ncbi:MAG TPA: hypothetical protein VF095_00650, partial [Bacillota bacterium]
MHSSKERQKVVREELQKIADAQYISQEVHTTVVDAYKRFYVDLLKKKEEALEREEEARKEEQLSATTDSGAVVADEKDTVQPHSAPKDIPKKKLSPQQIRGRNIKWLLNMGVLMLLIGGLVLATSTWSSMSGWMKTGLIFLSSLLFFGLARLMVRVLKLEKTAFAFYVLGALFLPIVILS